MKPNRYTIELAGIPGGGKSTVKHPLIQGLWGNGFASVEYVLSDTLIRSSTMNTTREVLNYGWKRFQEENPNTVYLIEEQLLGSSVHDGTGQALEALKGYWRSTASLWGLLFEQNAASRGVIIDEGLTQRILSSALGWKGRSKKMEETLDTAPVPDILVRVWTPPDLCAERMLQRKVISARFQGCKKEEILDWFKRFDQETGEVTYRLEQRGVRVLTVDNTDDYSGQIEEVLNTVHEVSGINDI